MRRRSRFHPIALVVFVLACTPSTSSKQDNARHDDAKQDEQTRLTPETDPESPPPPAPVSKHHDLHLADKLGGLVRVADGESTRVWDRAHTVSSMRVSRDGKLYAIAYQEIRVFDEATEDLPRAPFQVEALTETPKGEVWIVGRRMLARLEGETWTRHESGLDWDSLSWGTDLLSEADGTLWVLGTGGVAQRRGDGKFEMVSLDSLDSPNPAYEGPGLRGFLRPPEGGLAVHHKYGISRLIEDRWQMVDLGAAMFEPERNGRRAVLSHVIWPAKSGLVITSGGEVRQVQGDSFWRVFDVNEDANGARSIYDLAVDDDGRIWILTEDGLYMRDPKGSAVAYPSGVIPELRGPISDIQVRGRGPLELPPAQPGEPLTVTGKIVYKGKPRAKVRVQMCAKPAEELGTMSSPCEAEEGEPSFAESTTRANGSFELRTTPGPRRIAMFVDGWKIVFNKSCCTNLPAGYEVDLGKIEVETAFVVSDEADEISEHEQAMEEAARELE
ncbi:MAG: two-component regulator propeller domain-containing protein [Enhygromyxa sp.]